MHHAMAWFVYVLRCVDGSLYCGITKDVPARFATHVAGRGARYTRSHRPRRVVLCWVAGDQGQALREERWFKSLPRRVKDVLLEDVPGG
jgi:putative endonuclease